MVGGGAIRDTLLGAPVADIDIFYEGRLNDGRVQHILKVEPDRGWNVKELDPDYDVKVNRIVYVVPPFFPGPVLNLLEVDSVEDRFENFAADISKVFYSSRGLLLTSEFLEAVERRLVTFDPGTSDNYRCKIKDKFRPLGWSFSDEPISATRATQTF